jgi:hypothetical protein
MNLVTPKAGAKHEVLLSEPASAIKGSAGKVLHTARLQIFWHIYATLVMLTRDKNTVAYLTS